MCFSVCGHKATNLCLFSLSSLLLITNLWNFISVLFQLGVADGTMLTASEPPPSQDDNSSSTVILPPPHTEEVDLATQDGSDVAGSLLQTSRGTAEENSVVLESTSNTDSGNDNGVLGVTLEMAKSGSSDSPLSQDCSRNSSALLSQDSNSVATKSGGNSTPLLPQDSSRNSTALPPQDSTCVSANSQENIAPILLPSTDCLSIFACKQCGAKFLNSKSLAAHMYLHTGLSLNSRRFVCRVCGLDCCDGITYNVHIQEQHLEMCTALCEVNTKFFFFFFWHLKKKKDANCDLIDILFEICM
jgi:hypothetical protein